MKKSRSFVMGSLLAVLLGVSACSHSSSDAASTNKNNQSQTGHTSSQSAKKSSEPSDSPAESQNSNKSPDHSKKTSDHSDDNAANKTQSANNSNDITRDDIGYAVIHATLTLESKKEHTTVDYDSKTMIQSGQKVKLAIVPTSNDFKNGFVKEMIDNGGHPVTLYEYKVDHNNQLSLIDTSDESVVYSTEIEGSKEAFYGQWQIKKAKAYGPAGTYSSDDIKTLTGKQLTFSKEIATCFGDHMDALNRTINHPV